MKTGTFLTELKRRDVYKVAVAYVVVSWLLIQAASILLPTFDAPACLMKGFVALLALGFILSLVISWIFEMTPEGIKRTADISPQTTPDIVRQLEEQAEEQFIRGYLFALVHAGLGDKTKAIDYVERGNGDANVASRVDSLGNFRLEALADKIFEITRRAPPMLQISKQPRTLAHEVPAFPAVKQILGAPLTQRLRTQRIQALDTEKTGILQF
jgi:hypothetical protein